MKPISIHLHQTQKTIGDFENAYKILEQTLLDGTDGLHIFPELFLTGYPLQDLCLQKPFIVHYQQLLKRINDFSVTQKINSSQLMLFGGLHYEFQEETKIPTKITNVIYGLSPGQKLEVLYRKILLPNYDIFDEGKYFTSGDSVQLYSWKKLNLAFLICEDMWPSRSYFIDPVIELKKISDAQKRPIDLIVNLSASPFSIGKLTKRLERSKEISSYLQAPMVYVNQISGEDGILFDGGSFIVSNKETLLQLSLFKEELSSYQLSLSTKELKSTPAYTVGHSWESLFEAGLDLKNSPPTLKKLSEEELWDLFKALGFGVQEYARKAHLNKFNVALSGGIDSALVLTLLKLHLKQGQYLEAIYMPGLFSATQSYELSQKLCENLKIPLHSIPIKFVHKTVRNLFTDTFGIPLSGLPDENIQSRLRGCFLYTRSNQQDSMVLNTSNKSEIAVGYSTQYGDSVGALSVLGDLYKSEVFQLAHFINRQFNIIPEGILTRAPSAELRENQEDSQSLPPYERLDPILESILSNRYTAEEMIRLGHTPEEVKKSFHLFQRSEYKRYQFCPVIKVKTKSFDFGYRVPICKIAHQ